MQDSNKSKKARINENFVFIQAFSLFQKAEAEESTNFVKALNLYKQTLSLIDSIPERFPTTALALKIAQRKFRLGKSSYARIQHKIDSLRIKASREEMLEILHDCAVNLSLPDQRAEKLSDIALLFWRNGQQSHCLRVFSEASDAAEEVNDSFSRGRALNMLALKYAEIGEYERALTLSVFFADLSDQIRLLTDLGSNYYSKKMRERARQLFFNAIELAEREADPEKNAALIAWIAYKLAESEEYFWALEVAETIVQLEYRFSAIHQIVERLIGSGKFTNIQEFTRKIDEPSIKAELMVSLAMKYSADGYFSQAREAADTIDIPPLKAQAYLAIASQYKEKAHQKIAVDLVNEACAMREKIPEFEAKIQITTRAAEILYVLKQETRVRELLENAATLILSIPESFKRSEFLTYLVKTSLDLDQLLIADELSEKITEPDAGIRAVCDIAARHALLDNFALAQSKVMKIVALPQKYRGFFQIINSNPENRNFRAKLALLNEVVENIDKVTALDDADLILSECALQLAKLEKFHNALQVQETIKSDQVRDELLWKLAELKFKGDFFIEGIEIIRLIKDQNCRVSRLIQLGVAIHEGLYSSATFAVSDFLPIAFSFWLEEKEKIEVQSFQDRL